MSDNNGNAGHDTGGAPTCNKDGKEINILQCLKDGAIGSIGAIPGTIASHPFDALKIRVQATGISVYKTIPFILSNGIYSGLFAGIQQKIITRGPMFLFSAISTNICHVYGQLDLTTATFLGSAISGYLTGFIAAPREWVKILSQRSLIESHGIRLKNPLTLSFQNGNLWSVFQRCNAAGTRNGIFDSLFFGLRHSLTNYRNQNLELVQSSSMISFLLSPGCIYGFSAVSAATLDYVIDVTVKRMMIRPPSTEKLPGLLTTCHHLVSTQGIKLFQGLGVKITEMGISYYVTGFLSVYVIHAFSRLLDE